jgi:energy-coupling factor transport system substrate-specific component
MSGKTTTSAPVAQASGRYVLASRPLARWRAIDLISAAMVAVAFGVVFWAFDTFVYPGVTLVSTAFPPAGELALGVWLVPAVLGALIIRRPGAAVLTELVAANVELLLGNQWGVGVLLSGFLQGVGVEIVFAILLWRSFGLLAAIGGGMLSAALEIACYEWWAYVPSYSWAWKLVYLAAGILSGGVIAGAGGWALTRALARAGALNAFPAGREELERRAGKA